MLIGWILSFSSSLGNGCNDVFKKNLLKRGLNAWECMALLNSYGAILSLSWCLYMNELPFKIEAGILWGGLWTSLGKNLAQLLYYKGLQEAPLSLTIPYLAWNPVCLLLVGFLWLGEQPSKMGVLGCLIVLVGAYLISIDAKNKMAREKKEKMKKELMNADPEAAVFEEISNQKDSKNQQCFLIELAKSIWSFKAGLYIMGVSLCWTYTSAHEKYILHTYKMPAAYFLGVQRTFMCIPTLLYTIKKNPTYIEHTHKSIFYLFMAALNESMTVILYYMALEYVYVSYVIAIKRAGNIFLSQVFGRFIYKEKLTPLTMASAFCMILGVLAIVLG